ncbi:MAG: PIN/TRAM domain-containing protein [Planctomycetaceae bacterium]|nr:PIN/TRAM domain-containing protein [Planctomycetaceae bacterium]
MLHVVRALFVLACGTVGWVTGIDLYSQPWMGLFIGLGAGSIFMALQLLATRQLASVVVTLVFGILVGCLLAYFLIKVLDLLNEDMAPKARMYRNFAIAVVLSFLSVLTILHVKDDFKFVIPFVELKREGGGSKPVILDTSAIIDGRIADLMDTKVIDTRIIVPRFVLQELQQGADSQDKLKRNRGRRGLDILARLRKTKTVELQEVELPDITGVDSKLVRLAKNLDARIVTTDFNLNKVAQVQGVDVINLNDIASALRPVVLQGEKLTIKIIRTGESAGQGVGYLEDGTMVVAEECAGRIGQDVDLLVTNVLQTSSGRLIFGRPNAA